MTNIERKREYVISDRIDIQVEIEPVEFDALEPGIYIIGGKKVVVR